MNIILFLLISLFSNSSCFSGGCSSRPTHTPVQHFSNSASSDDVSIDDSKEEDGLENQQLYLFDRKSDLFPALAVQEQYERISTFFIESSSYNTSNYGTVQALYNYVHASKRLSRTDLHTLRLNNILDLSKRSLTVLDETSMSKSIITLQERNAITKILVYYLMRQVGKAGYELRALSELDKFLVTQADS